VTPCLTLDLSRLAGRTGRGVRVAIIDSGIAAGHPHVGPVGAGVWIRTDGVNSDARDRIGHGTAVAAAIREKAPAAELIPVRVFDRNLATTSAVLAEAIEWSASVGARLINLSLGTRNLAHRPLLEDALRSAVARGCLVVAAAAWEGEPCLPGSLDGAVGVLATDCPRDALLVPETLGGPLYASPFPRPIPGVPPESNLTGVSFAVANATGLLARLLEEAPEIRTAAGMYERLAHVGVPKEAVWDPKDGGGPI
jgi:subtilisin family serine protease